MANRKTNKHSGKRARLRGGRVEESPFPYPKKLKRKVYEPLLVQLQIELLKTQRWVKETGKRILILFEGRDAAGKGGAIKRFTQHLNPRGAPIVALPKPTEREQTQWYFQRYLPHLPSAGEMTFFDRSWYNRAGVEPVLGFCTAEQWTRFMRQTPMLERSLVQDGLLLFKLWFAVSQQEQQRRFEARRTDPLKRWKLSPIDELSVGRWHDYSIARDRMFFHTHTSDAPWTIIRSDDKKRARINAIRHVLQHLPYPDKDRKVVAKTDPLIVINPETKPGSTDRALLKIISTPTSP